MGRQTDNSNGETQQTRLRAVAITISISCGTSAPAVAQTLPCRYEVAAVIQAPPGGFGFPSPTGGIAISPNGRYIVGFFNPGAIGFDRAFAYDTWTDVFTALPMPPGTFQSEARDVNDAGLAVGSYWFTSGTALQRGFVYDIASGEYLHELLPLPGAAWCQVSGINSSNEVTGTRSIGSTGDPGNPRTAFRWTLEGGFVDLGLVGGNTTFGIDIANDGAVAVGVGFGLGAYLWDGKQSGTVGTIKGADGLTPNAIANDSHIVGMASFIQGADFWSVPFEFLNGVLESLLVLDTVNRSCTAMDVGVSGLVVGGCRVPTGTNWVPCAWVSGRIVDLRDLFPIGTGLFFQEVSAIADSGRLICNASPNGSPVAVVLDPVARVSGDTNCDERVDADDLIAVILDWGATASSADVTHDGIVDAEDLILIIESWTL